MPRIFQLYSVSDPSDHGPGETFVDQFGHGAQGIDQGKIIGVHITLIHCDH